MVGDFTSIEFLNFVC